MAKHQKHTKLTRPNYGNYARNEWGFVGTNCNRIKSICSEIASSLSASWNVGYMDADHKSGDEQVEVGPFNLDYEDKIHYHNFASNRSFNDFDFRHNFEYTDILLINGNHFVAKKQIVFIDPAKEKSLLKRIDQLTDIRAVVVEGIEPYDFIQEKIKDRNIPIIKHDQIQQLINIIETQYLDQVSRIKGLVLAGGGSTRMGKDKSQLKYHGRSHALHLYELLNSRLEEVYISTTKEKSEDWSQQVLPDSFLGLGPFGAILSAFRSDPNAAWFVLACDLPFVDQSAIEKILKNRDPSKYATAFLNHDTGFPDPLVTLWEPKSYGRILHFLAQGYSCPRKVLINSDVALIEPENNWLMNVNNPDEYQKAVDLISNKMGT